VSAIDPRQLAREPRRDRLALVLGWLGLLGRRHLAAPQLLHDVFPALAMLDQRRRRRERLEVQIALVLLVAVAGMQLAARNGLTMVSKPSVDAAVSTDTGVRACCAKLSTVIQTTSPPAIQARIRARL
jgi:hypothetical protein